MGSAAMGLASGFLVKKLVFRKTNNPIKIAAGLLLQTTVSGLVSNNSDKIKSTGVKLFQALLSKINSKKADLKSETQL